MLNKLFGVDVVVVGNIHVHYKARFTLLRHYNIRHSPQQHEKSSTYYICSLYFRGICHSVYRPLASYIIYISDVRNENPLVSCSIRTPRASRSAQFGIINYYYAYHTLWMIDAYFVDGRFGHYSNIIRREGDESAKNVFDESIVMIYRET